MGEIRFLYRNPIRGLRARGSASHNKTSSSLRVEPGQVEEMTI